MNSSLYSFFLRLALNLRFVLGFVGTEAGRAVFRFKISVVKVANQLADERQHLMPPCNADASTCPYQHGEVQSRLLQNTNCIRSRHRKLLVSSRPCRNFQFLLVVSGDRIGHRHNPGGTWDS